YLNYGSIGVVIGHEITHGFDDQGKQYAGDGTLQTGGAMLTTLSLARRRNASSIKIGMNVNGDLTQGENIADNGGLRESLRPSETAQRLPGKLSKFTPEQLFFVAYSQTWCEIDSPATLASQILSDPHSPGRFRSIGAVSNSDDFAKAFNCPGMIDVSFGNNNSVAQKLHHP
ncbi:Neutral endopeptidase, partial [Caligus rogercresseyi]